jgi:uncharacterized protein (DUF427 family)
MVEVLELTPAVRQARSKWRYRGGERPVFADACGPKDESVWDFPRPPRIEAVAAALRVVCGQQVLAASSRALRVLETAGAPTYYFPPEDVETSLLVDLADQSLCEWKGLATSFRVRDQPDGSPAAGWRYDLTFPEFVSIQGWFSFYPGVLACFISDDRGIDEQVRPQPGGYYGGWVTARLKGPIKGEPGSEAW